MPEIIVMDYSLQQVQSIVMEILKATVAVCEKNKIQYYAQAGTVLGAIRHKGPIPWDYDADIIIPNNQIDRFASCAKRDLPEKYYVDYFKVDPKSKRQFPRVGLKSHSTEVVHLDVFRLIGLPDDRKEQEKHLKTVKDFEKSAAVMRKTPVWKLLAKTDFSHAFGKLGLTGNTLKKNIMMFDKTCGKYDYDKANYVANPSGKYGTKNIFRKEVYGEGMLVDFLDFKIRIPSDYEPYLRQYYGDYSEFPPQAEIDKSMNKIYKVK